MVSRSTKEETFKFSKFVTAATYFSAVIHGLKDQVNIKINLPKKVIRSFYC